MKDFASPVASPLVTNKVLPVELPSSTTGNYSGTITFDIGLVDAK